MMLTSALVGTNRRLGMEGAYNCPSCDVANDLIVLVSTSQDAE